MDSKKINQLATEVAPVATDLTIIGNPTTGVSKKITLLQLASTIGVAATLQQITDNGATTTNAITIGGLSITGFSTGVLKSTSGVISSIPYGAANGVATLAGDGKVPSNQLPSYVDDVVEVANYAALPVTGETGKIYVTIDNNKVYRWTGSIYVEIAPNNAVWGAITGTLSNQTDLQNALNAKLSTATAASTYVPYTGANASVDLGLFNLSSTSVLVTGTAGSGHIHFRNQSSTPNGLTNYMTMYSNAAGTAIGIINTGGNAALLSISSLSANRTFTFPNASGTLALTSDISYPVSSVFGRTGAVVATNGDYTTDQVTEGSTNLYFTNTRARAAISLTTTGTSGASTYNNTTGVLNIPNYADQYVGTVTSVALSTPTGLTTSGSPITTSGTLAVTFTAGYSIPTTASQSTWDTAYTNRITSLTTTGSSGASTLSSNVLNVPNYTLSGLGGQPLATNLTSLSALTYASVSFVKMTAAGTFALDTTVYTSNTGTVTSVAASAGTGISISGSPITTSGTLTITNTAPDQTVVLTASTGISVTGSYPSFTITNTSPSSGGTVTSVAALTLGTSGTDLSSSVANGTTTPVITLNVPTASAANRGALSAADFTTFTNKQAAITLTTTGTSGAATFSSNTLNIPNYTITNAVTGTGTTNYLPKFTGTSTIGNSQIFDNGTQVGIGTATNTTVKLQVTTTAAEVMRLQGTSGGGSNNTQLRFYGSASAADLWAIGTEVSTGTSGRAFDFYDLVAGANRMRLDASGNLGLGVTPSAWSVVTPIMQISSGGGFIGGQGSANVIRMGVNTYYNGSNWIYINAGYASWFETGNGAFNWLTSGTSGSANATATFTQAMTLNASGNLSIGNTNDTYKLDVSGTGRFTGALTGTSATFSVGTSASFGFAVTQNSTFAFGSTNGKRVGLITSNSGDYPGLQFGYDATDNTGIIAGATNVLGAGIDFYTYNGSSWGNRLRIASTGAATFSSTIKTGTTSYGQGAIKLGIRNAGTATGAGGYMAIEIDGNTYFINLFTTTP